MKKVQTTQIADPLPYPHIGTAAGATQAEINDAVNSSLGQISNSFLYDIYSWSGSYAVTGSGYFNFLSLSGMTHSGGTAGSILSAALLFLPAKTNPSGLTVVVRISGTVAGAASSTREWKIQARQHDGVAVISSVNEIKAAGNDISNRDSVLVTHTLNAADTLTTQGFSVGIQNDTGATVTLTSVSVKLYRFVNAE